MIDITRRQSDVHSRRCLVQKVVPFLSTRLIPYPSRMTSQTEGWRR
jgi:hypothetical protein